MMKEGKFCLVSFFAAIILLGIFPAAFASGHAQTHDYLYNSHAEKPQPRISQEAARQIALEKSGGGDVMKCQLGRYKGGVMTYYVVVINQDMKYVYKISAETGEIFHTVEKQIRR